MIQQTYVEIPQELFWRSLITDQEIIKVNLQTKDQNLEQACLFFFPSLLGNGPFQPNTFFNSLFMAWYQKIHEPVHYPVVGDPCSKGSFCQGSTKGAKCSWHMLIFLLIRAGAQWQEALGVEAKETLDLSRQATSWEGQLIIGAVGTKHLALLSLFI